MFANNPYAEWYQNSLRVGDTPTRRYHQATYGTNFAYEDFAPLFNRAVEAWNPDEWATLFSRVGARYVVLTSKHHEGFLLWPGQRTSPKRPAGFAARRDLVGELTDAVRRHGMRMGLYYSGGLDWTFEARPVLDQPDVTGTIVQTAEFVEYVNAHFRELIDRYAPSVLWNDIGYPAAGHSPDLFAYYYNAVADGVINDRWSQQQPEPTPGEFSAPTGERDYHADYVTPEYTTFSGIQAQPWEMCRGIGHSFGCNLNEGEADYLSVPALIRLLVDVVSKNGNLLLNVGPQADGTIPTLQRERLIGLGDWLAVSGEAIFDTSPYTRADGKTADGLDVRYTRNGDALYAIVLDAPPSSTLTIEQLAIPAPQAVTLLGHAAPLSFVHHADSLTVTLPEASLPRGAFALRIHTAP
jgi:alpha-L-fucosidase